MSTTWGEPSRPLEPAVVTLARPTAEQREAIAVVRAIGAEQAAELALRQFLAERITARADVLANAYHALHVAYGGRAPLAVVQPLESDYYAILGTAPDGVDLPGGAHHALEQAVPGGW